MHEMLGGTWSTDAIAEIGEKDKGCYRSFWKNSISERNIYSLEYPGSFSASGRTKSKPSLKTQLENC